MSCVICTRRVFAYVVWVGVHTLVTAGCACGGPLRPSCVTPSLVQCACVLALSPLAVWLCLGRRGGSCLQNRHEPLGLALLQASSTSRVVWVWPLAFAAACQCSTTKHCRLPWGCCLRPVQLLGAPTALLSGCPKGCTVHRWLWLCVAVLALSGWCQRGHLLTVGNTHCSIIVYYLLRCCIGMHGQPMRLRAHDRHMMRQDWLVPRPASSKVCDNTFGWGIVMDGAVLGVPLHPPTTQPCLQTGTARLVAAACSCLGHALWHSRARILSFRCTLSRAARHSSGQLFFSPSSTACGRRSC
jgi:hypothetical protein